MMRSSDSSLRITKVFVLFLTVTIMAACSVRTSNRGASSLETEARVFMAEYGAEFARGDGAAIATRYSRGGAYIVDAEGPEFLSYPALEQRYRDKGPEQTFLFHGLTFEALGDNAVSVIGSIVFNELVSAAYSNVLIREDGLKIKLEHESFSNTPSPECASVAEPCDLPTDSVARAWFVGEYQLEGETEVVRIRDRDGHLYFLIDWPNAPELRLFRTGSRELRIGDPRGTRMIFVGSSEHAASYVSVAGVVRMLGVWKNTTPQQ